MIQKLYICVVWFFIIAAIGLIGLITFWSTYPYKPIVFTNLPFPVDKTVYKPKDILQYKVEYCKNTNLIPIVTRYFVNGIVYLASSNPAVQKPKGCGSTTVQIVVPESLMKDTYYLKINYRYQVNPIRTVNVMGETEKFAIIE
jgi:hypothetical protein